jgi:hypothetical protein
MIGLNSKGGMKATDGYLTDAIEVELEWHQNGISGFHSGSSSYASRMSKGERGGIQRVRNQVGVSHARVPKHS